jgi:hypothetical protein
MGGIVLEAHKTQIRHHSSVSRWKDSDLHPPSTVWENIYSMQIHK